MTVGFVALSHVGKTYASPRGDVVALADINLEIEPGEFISVLGPSGCGKSTLLKCIGGLETATTGDIRIGGSPLAARPVISAWCFRLTSCSTG